MITIMDRISGRSELSELLRATSEGDPRAFETLYFRTSAKLYGICLRLLSDEAEAQDVLQETYVRVWRKANLSHSKASPITWLAIVARNKAIDRLRQRTPRTDEFSAADGIADDGPTAIEVIERNENRRGSPDVLKSSRSNLATSSGPPSWMALPIPNWRSAAACRWVQ